MPKENIIVDKSFQFALDIISLYVEMQDQKEFVLSKQLLRSGTSICANVEEAVGGFSKKDFTAKIGIALKESRETRYWLRLLDKSKLVDGVSYDKQLKDAESLINILSAIVKSSKQNINSSNS